MTWEWDNTTYYDDEGLRYLIERVMAAARGIQAAPGQPQDHDPTVEFGVVIVRYFSGEGMCSVRLDRKWSSGPKADRPRKLRVSISRRNGLFGSALETVAELGGDSPMMPPEAVEELGTSLLHATTDHSFGNALRREYGQIKEERTWGWPPNAARELIRQEVLPVCEIAIHERAKTGSTLQAKLSSARDTLERRKDQFDWAQKERISAQQRMDEAVEAEQRAKVALIRAEIKFKELERKED